jgi:hypothetical protein
VRGLRLARCEVPLDLAAAMSASRTTAPAPGFANITIPKRIETTPVSPRRTLSLLSSGSENASTIARNPSVKA